MLAKNDSATALSNGVPGFEKEDFTYNTTIQIKDKDNVLRGNVYYENYHEENKSYE